MLDMLDEDLKAAIGVDVEGKYGASVAGCLPTGTFAETVSPADNHMGDVRWKR